MALTEDNYREAVRLVNLRYGPKAIFDFYPSGSKQARHEDLDARGKFAGDYTNRQAYEIALLAGIDDPRRIQTALAFVEEAHRLSEREQISLRTALAILLEAQKTDPLYLRVRKWRDAWIRIRKGLQRESK